LATASLLTPAAETNPAIPHITERKCAKSLFLASRITVFRENVFPTDEDSSHQQ
jgi:hypothetical protein